MARPASAAVEDADSDCRSFPPTRPRISDIGPQGRRGPADSLPVKIDGLPIEAQVSAAVARKAQSVQKVLGQAALDLIETSGSAAPAPSLDGRGQHINTRA